MLIATASGWTVGDVRPLTRLNVTAIAEEGGKREIGSYGGGGRVTFDFFLGGRAVAPLRHRGGAPGRAQAERPSTPRRAR